MSEPYLTLAERGDRRREDRRMHVMVYPNTPTERVALARGSPVLLAIRYCADQLFDAGAIVGYRLARFPPEDAGHTYPRVDPDEIRWAFKDYLRGPTDDFSDRSWCTDEDGDDLTRYRGAHLLVHDYGFSVDLAGADPVDCRHNGGTGFSRGVVAWTGLEDGTGEGLARNSAIHETVHVFVRATAEPVQKLLCDADGDDETEDYEEHTLGAIDSTGAATPMLTYHVDEHRGCRHPQRAWDGSYTQELTARTKAAVYFTARNPCRPRSDATDQSGE